MKKYYTCDRETGTIIDYFPTIEEAEKAVRLYEIEDIDNGDWTPNFYEIGELDSEE